MATNFYSLEEAAAKLGKTVGELEEMVKKGAFQEFKEGNRLVLSRKQVDQAASSGDDMIPLADSGELSLDPKGGSSAAGTASGTKEKSGISIFEADELEEADANAQTQITQTAAGTALGDPNASGSGLLGLTREADDTSIGGGILEDVYGDKGGSGDGTKAPESAGAPGGDLFEQSAVPSDVSAAMAGAGMAMIAAEPYDGAGSGLVGGLSLVMILVAALGMVVTISALGGVDLLGLVAALGPNALIVLGGAAVAALLFAGIGWFLGSKS